jgi:hypothetical protein
VGQHEGITFMPFLYNYKSEVIFTEQELEALKRLDVSEEPKGGPMSTIKAERIRHYAEELDKQQCVQPSMKMVIVAMLRHVADAIEGRDPPPWKEVKPS